MGNSNSNTPTGQSINAISFVSGTLSVFAVCYAKENQHAAKCILASQPSVLGQAATSHALQGHMHLEHRDKDT